jgi:hypothetical protein
MKLIRLLIGTALIALLAACGGGGGSPGATTGGSLPTGTSTTAVISPGSIELLADSAALASGGRPVQLTAIVKNLNNVSMANQTVTFSADSGNISIAGGTNVSNESGVVTALLTTGANLANRNITIRASSGGASTNLVIPVTGTKIQITGPVTIKSGETASYTIKLLDSAGVAIPNQPINITSSLGNVLSGSGRTDANGTAEFIYTASRSGADRITASGLGVNQILDLAVSNVDFVAVSPASNSVLVAGNNHVLTFRYRVGGAGQAGISVLFSASRGELSAQSAVTNANGEVSVTIRSVSSGAASVVASIENVGQAILPLEFVSIAPTSVALQANPGAVSPNPAGTSNNQAAMEAIVRDASGNAVANRQVNFTITQDPSGGRLSQSSALTDANGRASVQYIAGSSSTASNGVVVRALVAGTDISSLATLTVNGESLFISIAFGNVIENLTPTTYKKPFSVYVTDANGVAVGNKDVTLRVIPVTYGKGFLSYEAGSPATPTSEAIRGGWKIVSYVACPNEDTNLNGSIDPGEDRDNDGRLDPGNVVVTAPGRVRTDAQGFASFDLLYGEQYAYWADVRLEARATVGGTESVSSILYVLEVSATDVATQDITPANVVSPFGRAQSCTDPR